MSILVNLLSCSIESDGRSTRTSVASLRGEMTRGGVKQGAGARPAVIWCDEGTHSAMVACRHSFCGDHGIPSVPRVFPLRCLVSASDVVLRAPRGCVLATVFVYASVHQRLEDVEGVVSTAVSERKGAGQYPFNRSICRYSIPGPRRRANEIVTKSFR